MVKNDAATSRRSSPTRAAPLTERQLADVRAAVDRVRGSGALSVKVHGVIVFLGKQECAPRKLPKPPPMTPAAGSDGAATTRKPDELLSSRQRRSRRRLEAHVALNAAATQLKRTPHPRAGECEATPQPSPSPTTVLTPAAPKGAPRPSPPTSSKKAKVCHPARVERLPEAWNMRCGPRGAPARVTGEGGKGRALPTPAAHKAGPSGKQPASSSHINDSDSDEGPPLPSDVMYDY